ncbi:MAG TPA: CoA transferase, partial [Solirubrobacteraceae bacterium]|nr:CoA transferase [Solirubrobacteraceae bacterium]
MSGFAHITGEADGPPTLPPFGLADGIAGIMAAFAVMVALRHRERTGEGQVIDISLIEPILLVLGAQATVFDQLGIVQRRSGNRSANNAPRNTYRTRDGRWVAVSTSATPVAERVMRLVGRDDLVAQPWFATGRGRAQHADELDEAVGRWIGEHDLEEVVRRFDEAQAAVAPVYDIQQALADPQYRALETFIRVPDPELGSVLMQNVPFRMQATPGRVRWAGEPLGASTDAVLESVGIAPRAQRRCR